MAAVHALAGEAAFADRGGLVLGHAPDGQRTARQGELVMAQQSDTAGAITIIAALVGLFALGLVGLCIRGEVEKRAADPTPLPVREIDPESCYGLSTAECREIWFDK